MTTSDRTKLPGARKTPGVAVGRSLLPSREEWAVRNRVLATTQAALINEYAPGTTGRAVEVGCQWGLLLEAVAPQTSKRWWGVDPVVERHLSRAGHQLVNGLANEMPFPDASFDAVLFANVYEHVPPPARDASLVEMKRVLVPGGVIVGQLPNPRFPIESHSKLPFMGLLPPRAQNWYWRISPARRGAGFYSVTAGDLRRRAEAAGLEVVLMRNFTYPPDAAPNSVRWLVRRMGRPLGVIPWAWQFVLRRPASDKVTKAGTDDYSSLDSGESEALPADLRRTPLVDRLLETAIRFRAQPETLPRALDEALQVLATDAHGASTAERFAIDQAVIDTAMEMTKRDAGELPSGQPLYRGPEWQWMQEALRLIAVQAAKAADGPPDARLGMADFKTTL